jgi:hypothetical protein
MPLASNESLSSVHSESFAALPLLSRPTESVTSRYQSVKGGALVELRVNDMYCFGRLGHDVECQVACGPGSKTMPVAYTESAARGRA